MNALDGRQLHRILVTHTHADHSPAAQQIAELTNAELVGLAPPEGGRNDRTFSPARLYQHGEVLTSVEFNIELIHTPGHVSNHFCYLLKEEEMLFTGDHILQGTTSVILPPDGDMGDYMTSLELLRSRSLRYLAPGHGDLITEPMKAIDALIAHRNRREKKIVQVMGKRQGSTGLDDLTAEVYDDVEPHLLPWAKKTLEAHLIKLRRESRARETAAGWQLESIGADAGN